MIIPDFLGMNSYRKPLSGKWNFSGFAQWLLRFYLSVCVYVQHNTSTSIDLQSWKFKYSFLTRIPRKFLDRFFEILLFLVSKFFLVLFDCLGLVKKKLVKHNTLIPSELQSCKFKYSFLTRVPRKVFERFSKFCYFLVSKFSLVLFDCLGLVKKSCGA